MYHFHIIWWKINISLHMRCKLQLTNYHPNISIVKIWWDKAKHFLWCGSVCRTILFQLFVAAGCHKSGKKKGKNKLPGPSRGVGVLGKPLAPLASFGPSGDLGPLGPNGNLGSLEPSGDLGSLGPSGDLGSLGPSGDLRCLGRSGDLGSLGASGDRLHKGPLALFMSCKFWGHCWFDDLDVIAAADPSPRP